MPRQLSIRSGFMKLSHILLILAYYVSRVSSLSISTALPTPAFEGKRDFRPEGLKHRRYNEHLNTSRPLEPYLLEEAVTQGDTGLEDESAYSILWNVSTWLGAAKHGWVNGTEAVWQLPGDDVAPRGVLLVLHGCHHGALDFWPKSKACPHCKGLPEEMNTTLQSLARGYAVVAISPSQRTPPHCWQGRVQGPGTSPRLSGSLEDFVQVTRVLQTVLEHEADTLRGLPVYGFGFSSGGIFLASYASEQPSLLTAVAIAMTATGPHVYEQHAEALRAKRVAAAYPPTLFLAMDRDTKVVAEQQLCMQALKAMGVATHVLHISPRPLTPLYLAQRCGPEVDERLSRAIHAVLRSAEYIDESGYLRVDPRNGGYEELLNAQVSGYKGHVRRFPSPISSELTRLYAVHAMCAERAAEMWEWFERQPLRRPILAHESVHVAAGSGVRRRHA